MKEEFINDNLEISSAGEVTLKKGVDKESLTTVTIPHTIDVLP